MGVRTESYEGQDQRRVSSGGLEPGQPFHNGNLLGGQMLKANLVTSGGGSVPAHIVESGMTIEAAIAYLKNQGDEEPEAGMEIHLYEDDEDEDVEDEDAG